MRPSTSQLVFKIATDPGEIEQIQRLHYRTFVEEIPQHPPNAERRLVDRFHAQNVYLAGLLDGKVIATLALRTERPFSLDSKLPDVDRYLPAGYAPVEMRLLAVEPEFRHSAVFAAMLEHGVRHALSIGRDLAVLSGTTRQLRLYRNLGCVAFGPLVGTTEASYQPMYLTLDALHERSSARPRLREMLAPRQDEPNAMNFLPGPITPAESVRTAFAAPPISHRSAEFAAQMEGVRERLCRLTHARAVAVLVGSGSLANDVIAAQLALGDARGLVLSNGEFGERLADHARRARMEFEHLAQPWGTPFDLARVRASLARLRPGAWVWFVHHETSTGVLNPLRELVRECEARGLRACVDCISSLGAVPVDLRGVHLASGTSGKGLGSYPGLALVFYARAPRPMPERLAATLDLGHWAEHDSVPFTHSSNLLAALAAALRGVTSERMERIADLARQLRADLARLQLRIVARDEVACPAIVTVTPPPGVSAFELGEALDLRGCWSSYRSAYLVQRNWLQFALLGDPPPDSVARLTSLLERLLARSSAIVGACAP